MERHLLPKVREVLIGAQQTLLLEASLEFAQPLKLGVLQPILWNGRGTDVHQHAGAALA
jgi:hypothetical protein